jgi:hypothetical protein
MPLVAAGLTTATPTHIELSVRDVAVRLEIGTSIAYVGELVAELRSRLRKARSRPVLKRLDAWREKMTPLFEPKSAMGDGLRYMKNQWTRLTAFVRDPLIPLHNNASEAALRIVALFRKNSLFFGNEKAARRLMVLYSLIAMCERHEVNPEAYLTDVLLKIQDQAVRAPRLLMEMHAT